METEMLWTFDLYDDPTWVEWIDGDVSAEYDSVESRLDEILDQGFVNPPPIPRAIRPAYDDASAAWATVWAVLDVMEREGAVSNVVWPDDPAGPFVNLGGIDGGPLAGGEGQQKAEFGGPGSGPRNREGGVGRLESSEPVSVGNPYQDVVDQITSSGSPSPEDMIPVFNVAQERINDRLSSAGLDNVSVVFTSTSGLEAQAFPKDTMTIFGELKTEADTPPRIESGFRSGEVGKFNRIVDWGNNSVENHYFEISPFERGQGMAAIVNSELTSMYAALGLEKETLYANIDVGGYAWAKAGYDWDLSTPKGGFEGETGFESVLTAMDEADKLGLNDEEKQQLINWQEAIYNQQEAAKSGLFDAVEGLPMPIDIAMLGWEPDAKTWPGKEIMLSTGWYGVRPIG